MNAALLEVRGLTKKFGGVTALDGIDLAVERGEILGLIGPNGSGKTTLFNVVTGIYGADAGAIRFEGAEIGSASPQKVHRAGISRTFQRSRLALPLSIFDNIMIGNHKRLSQGLWFNLIRRGAFKREFAASYRAACTLVEVFEPQLAAEGAFDVLFRAAKERVRAMDFRFVAIDDPALSTVFEVYVAIAPGTAGDFNLFETH